MIKKKLKNQSRKKTRCDVIPTKPEPVIKPKPKKNNNSIKNFDTKKKK